MMKIVLLLAFVAVLAGGCCSKNPSGSREFIPGKGWEPVK